MGRLLRFTAALGLGLAVLATPPMALPTAWADDTNPSVTPDDSEHPQDIDNTVEGIVYHIRDREGVKVVTVYDRNVGKDGHGVDLYVKDRGLLGMISSGAVCVGRYVTAVGVRTGPHSMDVEGFTVDYNTGCGQPPQ